MVARIISDAGLVVSSLSNGVFSIFGDGMSLIALLVTAFWLDWGIGESSRSSGSQSSFCRSPASRRKSPRNQESAEATERPAIAAA